MRPATLLKDSTLYWTLSIRDSAGELVNADSTPTVAVRKNGASVGDSVTVSKRSATTGLYDCAYNPASEAEGDQFTLEETATIGGIDYFNAFGVSVVDNIPTISEIQAAAVIVSPVSAAQVEAQRGNDITRAIGDGSAISIRSMVDAQGNALNLAGKTLRVYVMSSGSTPATIHTIESGSITVFDGDSTNDSISWVPNSATYSTVRELLWSLRDVDDSEAEIAFGSLKIKRRAWSA